MMAAFALDLHGECRWVFVKCFAGRFARWLLLNRGWMAAPSYDLGRCCNYEMAVWERKGEDKAIWRGNLGKKRTDFLKKKMKEGCWRKRRDFLEQHSRELGRRGA
jgi:hypothetical protein